MTAVVRAAEGAPLSRRSRGVLPGFGLSTGFTVVYLCVVVLLPLSTLAFKASPSTGLLPTLTQLDSLTSSEP